MAEDMKDAWKGQGSGLQGASSAVGDMMAGETQSGSQKKATAANESLNQFVNGDKKSGATVGGTSVSAQDQIANQQTGSADHLGMGMRK
ncbi:hypothetical protein HII31_10852 [Pseudocercospora fuligena]|uniref:Uncharacterized protein n=1 Tax=Pseudocercospora fuligena TaxID=685502 RepID=A0A8H6RCA6_9PEZI|nr:hypothetical protein HII31_10852 [Pseudocercospora fuligena]